MNKEKQRIAIAEFCGWSQDEMLDWWAPDDSEWFGTNWGIDMLPDYLNDLNAMHSALMSAGILVRMKVEEFLPTIKGCNPVFATAEQRAEALLKTIGRWEDE